MRQGLIAIAVAGTVLLAGCAESDMNFTDPGNGGVINLVVPEVEPIPEPAPDGNDVLRNEVTFIWPSSLRVLGDGYPAAGDHCRRLGETALVADYLDDSATLVGCPTGDAAEQIKQIVADGGKEVGAGDGVTFISVPGRQ